MKSMNKLLNLFFSFTLVISLMFLSACDNKEVQSFDQGPSALDVDVNINDLDANGESLLKLRAAPQQTVVDLDWDAVDGAVDYRVSRELQQASSNVIVELTGGETSFSFATSSDQTYLVRVAALDGNDTVLKLSKVITVKTASLNAIQKSDEAL